MKESTEVFIIGNILILIMGFPLYMLPPEWQYLFSITTLLLMNLVVYYHNYGMPYDKNIGENTQ